MDIEFTATLAAGDTVTIRLLERVERDRRPTGARSTEEPDSS